MAIAGASILTQIMGILSDKSGNIATAYIVPAFAFAVIAYYAFVICKKRWCPCIKRYIIVVDCEEGLPLAEFCKTHPFLFFDDFLVIFLGWLFCDFWGDFLMVFLVAFWWLFDGFSGGILMRQPYTFISDIQYSEDCPDFHLRYPVLMRLSWLFSLLDLHRDSNMELRCSFLRATSRTIPRTTYVDITCFGAG